VQCLAVVCGYRIAIVLAAIFIEIVICVGFILWHFASLVVDPFG
jgi:hypothetical protein